MKQARKLGIAVLLAASLLMSGCVPLIVGGCIGAGAAGGYALTSHYLHKK